MVKLISALLLFSTTSFAGSELVQFVPNRTHALLYFLDTISGNPHTSRTLKESFKQSKYNTREAQKELREFQAVLERLPSFSFSGYPESRHVGADLREILMTQSLFASDLHDFSKRILGLLPQDQHQKILDFMEKYSPIYEELLWSKSSKKLVHFIDILKSKIKVEKLNKAFRSAVSFYGSSRPKNSPFYIGVYPVDCRRGHVSAESLASVETMGVCVDSEKVESQWAIAFHEMSHSLYQNQAPKLQQDIESMFLSSKSKYALKAYAYLNEVLATAVGNGWFYQYLTGELDRSRWYNDEYINTMAKTMQPEVEKYFKNSKQIDKSFIENYIGQFEKKFPASIYEFDSLFGHLMVFSDSSVHDRKKFRADLNKNFRVRSWSFYENPSPTDLARHMGQSVGDSFVFLLGTSASEVTKKIIDSVPFIKKNADKIFSQKGYFVGVDEKGRAFVVLNQRKAAGYSKTLNYFKTKKLMTSL